MVSCLCVRQSSSARFTGFRRRSRGRALVGDALEQDAGGFVVGVLGNEFAAEGTSKNGRSRLAGKYSQGLDPRFKSLTSIHKCARAPDNFFLLIQRRQGELNAGKTPCAEVCDVRGDFSFSNVAA